jgi:putative phosphoesterase
MEIGILSDSHITKEFILDNPKSYKNLLSKINILFEGVSSIIHAGDVECIDFITDIEKIAPVNVVSGNMDYNFGPSRWPRILSIEIEGIKIGIIHQLEHLLSYSKESSKDYNVIIYGHTHIPLIKSNSEDVFLINPGSIRKPRAPRQNRFFENPDEIRPSVAILSIDEGIFSAIIRKF